MDKSSERKKEAGKAPYGEDDLLGLLRAAW